MVKKDNKLLHIQMLSSIFKSFAKKRDTRPILAGEIKKKGEKSARPVSDIFMRLLSASHMEMLLMLPVSIIHSWSNIVLKGE